MEEQRKKFGMELLPSLHKQLKQVALGRDIPLWQATQEAVRLYVEPKSAPSQMFPVENAPWHEKLEFVLKSGDPKDLTGIQRNLDWAANDIKSRPGKSGSRRKAG